MINLFNYKKKLLNSIDISVKQNINWKILKILIIFLIFDFIFKKI